MKAFGSMLVVITLCVALNVVQEWRIRNLKDEVSSLTRELDVAHATQRADRETFAMQIKLVREASKHADNAHKNLSQKSGLSDADWLNDVLAGMWRKDTDGSGTAASVDAGAVRGTASGDGTATGTNASPVQRGNDAQGN